MSLTGARGGARRAIGLLAFLAFAGPAAAQDPTTIRTPIMEYRVPIIGPRVGPRDAPELAPAVQAELERGRELAAEGRLDAAREVFAAALEKAPHHPAILLELSQVQAARGAWRAIEQLARAERVATRDSLLLAQDLVTALERLGKPRDAAQVVLEAWVASPAHVEWAQNTLDTLAAADSKGTREAVRRTAAAFPLRADLLRGAAMLEWRSGDTATALKLLDAGDDAFKGAPLRWAFADELLLHASARDSAGAIEVLVDLAGDRDREPSYRIVAARRAWETYGRRAGASEGAPRLARALEDIPVARWGNPLAIEVIRGLREAGATDESRRLLRALGEGGQRVPEIAIERALNDLKDGPPERSLEALRGLAEGSDEACFRYAEALFFSGQTDSALVWYGKATHDPASPFTGPALERTFLIEDADPKEGLGLYGRLAYEQWRGDGRRALTLADSLYRSLPHRSLWARAAIDLAALREAAGDGKAGLEPLLALAQGLPDDRLAPLARQRAGDVYRVWYHDEAKAMEQYEECLARYPKAWNAPEVRRWVESMRREKRF